MRSMVAILAAAAGLATTVGAQPTVTLKIADDGGKCVLKNPEGDLYLEDFHLPGLGLPAVFTWIVKSTCSASTLPMGWTQHRVQISKFVDDCSGNPTPQRYPHPVRFGDKGQLHDEVDPWVSGAPKETSLSGQIDGGIPEPEEQPVCWRYEIAIDKSVVDPELRIKGRGAIVPLLKQLEAIFRALQSLPR